MARFWAACFLILFWLPSQGLAEGLLPLPPLSGRVVDLTGTLDVEQKSALETISLRLEQQNGAQVGVLMLPSTRPESIEQFGIRLAESWKLGRKGVDDGLIIIVAKDDRRMRIEVGYGLEGVIPDAIAKRIISEQMMPRFKQADFAGGLMAAMKILAEHIDAASSAVSTPPEGEARSVSAGVPATPADGSFSTLAEAPVAAQNASASPIQWSPDILLAVLAGTAVIGQLLRRLIGNLFGTASMAGAGGLLGWWLLGGFSGLILGGVVAVLVSIFGMDLIFSVLSARAGGSSGGRSGGFSGGGGGFGGGGASGEW